ncbi:metallophosphoesterase [Alicyclobacillus fastidiosus]|uniref:Metallophosphoesterase n=1 Tax=Alicyclobacillus fastidiosus TaxID=392011 RepID=A0ABY6ZDC0_9BACL|nr:metallophosphoesterase [Alicyclobacillus fastidiosus]WAH40522.1 metallophosphoesterase [Alicyclobacillus fastidiosus]GMA61946.1 putative metallophosphoesterase YkoQ [Alicyclobacillus fastidiosus]
MYWIIGAVCVAVGIFYTTFVLPTRWLKVERVRIPLNTGLKLVQISDLHVERNRIRPAAIKAVIDKESPDLLCITGDFLDQRNALVLLVPFLKMLQSTGIKTYAVLGNHDYMLKQPSELIQLLEEFGIQVLINEAVELQTVNLVGIDDFDSGHSDDTVLQSVTPGKPIVVMTHDPTLALFMNRRVDYMFAGHLHGKQFNIPFLFKLKNMGPLAASGVYKGVHETERGTLYISKGVGQSGYNFRFLVRSEITVHEL